MLTPRQSRIRRIFAARQSASCIKLNLHDPRVVEIAGLAGFDSIWLCNEHVPNTWENIENQIRAARLYGMDAIVRVEKGSYSDYIKPFDMDAMGIMVPMVNSVEEARDIVNIVRPYPLGTRAMDAGNIAGLYSQLRPDKYLKNLLEERIIIVQVENEIAIDRVEEIIRVDGIDGVAFGPGDFTHSIGKYSDTSDPRVGAALARIGLAAKAAGKFAMSIGMPMSQAEQESLGYRLFTTGADVIGLLEFFRERANLIRQDNLPSNQGYSPYRS